MKLFTHLLKVLVLSLLLSFQVVSVTTAKAADKTGNNPINFTYDARLYNEYQWLNTPGGGHENITTLQYKVPIADGKWQFQIKLRGIDIKADTNDDGFDDINQSGLGDTEIRFLTVPYLNMATKTAVATGVEITFDTAADDSLGSGATILAPQIFVVFFKPFGGNFDLFAPAYKQEISIDEDEGRSQVNEGIIDLYLLKSSKDKKSWLMLDPQIVFDFENDQEYAEIDIEVGTMLDPYLGTNGHSAYIRPSFGVGKDRPYDGSLEVGYKVVW